jgi:hypothetical protein
MKILDWLRGDDSDEDEKPEEERPAEDEEVPGDEDDPTTYPLW